MNLDYVSGIFSEKFQRILRPGPLRSPSGVNCASQLKHKILGELPEITSCRGLTTEPQASVQMQPAGVMLPMFSQDFITTEKL